MRIHAASNARTSCSRPRAISAADQSPSRTGSSSMFETPPPRWAAAKAWLDESKAPDIVRPAISDNGTQAVRVRILRIVGAFQSGAESILLIVLFGSAAEYSMEKPVLTAI